jgi:hypothetical protein
MKIIKLLQALMIGMVLLHGAYAAESEGAQKKILIGNKYRVKVFNNLDRPLSFSLDLTFNNHGHILPVDFYPSLNDKTTLHGGGGQKITVQPQEVKLVEFNLSPKFVASYKKNYRKIGAQLMVHWHLEHINFGKEVYYNGRPIRTYGYLSNAVANKSCTMTSDDFDHNDDVADAIITFWKDGDVAKMYTIRYAQSGFCMHNLALHR